MNKYVAFKESIFELNYFGKWLDKNNITDVVLAVYELGYRPTVKKNRIQKKNNKKIYINSQHNVSKCVVYIPKGYYTNMENEGYTMVYSVLKVFFMWTFNSL